MKHTNAKGNKQTNAVKQQQQRPEIRDNLDSREGEEQLTKGSDSTHNKIEQKSRKKSTD